MSSPKHSLTRREDDASEDRSALPALSRPSPMWAYGSPQPKSNFASYLEIPFIHKRLIVVCTLMGMLLGWLAIVVWPRSYISEAKLLIRVGRETVALDPTATTSSTVMLQKTQEEDIISGLELLNSRRVAELVVEKIGPDAIISGDLPDSEQPEDFGDSTVVKNAKRAASAWLYNVLKLAGIKDEISSEELAVQKLQKTVGIYSPRKSNVIIVDAQAETPHMAQAIVNAVTSSFLDEHLNAAHNSGSHEFFEKQCIEAENQLEQLVSERSKFMQDNKLVSIESNGQLLQQQLAGIDRDVTLASGELEKAISEIADLKIKSAGTPNEIIAEKSQGSDLTWSGMRQRVYNLELEELRHSAIFTTNHPQLQAIREELAGARKVLATLESERVDESITPNPTAVGLREELQRQQTKIVGLRSILEQKIKKRAQTEEQVHEHLEHERHLTQVDRNIRIMDASLVALREKLEESRVVDEIHQKGLSNVHIFQPATYAERAISPKKPILAIGFSMLGLMIGLGLCFLRQANSRSLRTLEDVEYELGFTVVSSIPRLPKMDSLRLREQKLYRDTCQALIAEILLSPGRPQTTKGRSVAIIGVDAGAGASTLAANLAISSGVDCRLRTILVDADARQRSVSKMFGLNGQPGLVELVNGNASHDECRQHAQNVPIDLVASAADFCDEPLSSSPADIVQALQAYQQDSDLLIVDLPAASQPEQAVALAQHLDCVLVVIESEKTLTVAAERLLRRLSESNTEVIGIVLNKTRSYLPKIIRRFVAP